MKKIQLLSQLLKRLRVIMPKQFRKRLPLIIILSIFAALLETLGIAIIVPFMNTLLNTEELYQKWYVVVLENIFHINNYYSLLLVMGVCIVLVYVIKNLVLLWVRQYCNKYQVGAMATISEELLSSTIKRNYTYHLNSNSSELLAGIFRDSEAVYQVLMSLIAIMCEFITVIGIGVFILLTDWMIAIGLVCIAIVVVFLIVFGFKKTTVRSGIQYRENYNRMYQDALQTIGGIKEIKASNCGQYFDEKFRKDRDAFGRAQLQANFINLCPERIVEVAFIGGIILLLVFRVRWGADINESIVSLSAFALAGYRLLPSVNKLSTNFNNIIFYNSSLTATYENVCKAREEEVRIASFIEKTLTDEKQAETLCLKNAIHIKDISFGYNDEKRIIEDVNLCIRKGTAIAFVGETGSGKSTMIDLILGLLEPQKGCIMVDDTDIHSIPKRWTELVGYVPQTIYLLDASIRENIAFGVDAERIDDNRITDCMKKAQLDKFIEKLPEGVHTVVGEQGVRLSGGQRQRIAIARALYKNPDILVLDEATSALDVETEKAVMSAIDLLHGEKTLIIVAHRLSTIAGCDEIYEVKDGGIQLKEKMEVLSKE